MLRFRIRISLLTFDDVKKTGLMVTLPFVKDLPYMSRNRCHGDLAQNKSLIHSEK